MVKKYKLPQGKIKVGLIGTGYAAKKRAEAFQHNPHSELINVVGNNPHNTRDFSQTFQIPSVETYQALINNPEIDLVCISNINRDHGFLVKSALLADKHVIVEYPLTTKAESADSLIKLAEEKQKLLHIEHIEIIGGVHQAIKKHIEEIGTPFLARYQTIMFKSQQPPHWTYSYDQYGFPLMAALSRINRFIDLFGEVETVSGCSRFWDAKIEGYFTACYCQAQLKFKNQMMVNIIYGKGDQFKISDRTLEIHGNNGTLLFVGEKGKIIRGKEEQEIEVGSRRGLFTTDTNMVIDHLLHDTPLYIDNHQSVYSLKIAQAVHQASLEQKIISF